MASTTGSCIAQDNAGGGKSRISRDGRSDLPSLPVQMYTTGDSKLDQISLDAVLQRIIAQIRGEEDAYDLN